MSADASLISVTAKLAAYYRQFTDIPFATEAAILGGAESVQRAARSFARVHTCQAVFGAFSHGTAVAIIG